MKPSLSHMTRALKQEALALGVHVEIERGNNGERGNITLTAPKHHCFSGDVHSLVTEQADDYAKGKLEPWVTTVVVALGDLRDNKLEPCPPDCECREDADDTRLRTLIHLHHNPSTDFEQMLFHARAKHETSYDAYCAALDEYAETHMP